MSVGTPNFVGDRLREAREARGLTGSALADLVGVKRASISLYETGRSSPQAEVMAKLAFVLGVPRAFFLKKPSQPEVNSLFYRSMSAATKTDRLKATRRFTWLRQLTSYLRGFVRFPRPNLPPIDVPTELASIDVDLISSAASETRKYWGLGNGPISDVTLLLENNGVIISKVTLDTMKMDAFSGMDTESRTPYVILSDDKGSAVRSRFDLAHELGHLVLHQNLPQRMVANPINNKTIEAQANEFASSFLLPEGSFSEDLYVVSLDSLKALKSKWLVSVGAMLRRAQALDLTTERQAHGLWINYSRRGWRKHEPMDDELKSESPRLLRRAFELLITKGVREPDQISSDLCLYSSDISELASMGEELFARRSPAYQVVIETSVSRDLGVTKEYFISGEMPQSIN